MLAEIQQKAARGEIDVSEHAAKQLTLRNISATDIREAFATARVIEDYPGAAYGPCCLIFGLTASNRPLHFVVTYPDRPRLRIITGYEPDPTRWVDFITRR